MGVPANSVWLPLMLMAITMTMATLAIAQSNDTASSNNDNNSPSSSPMPSTTTTSDLVVSGDLNKAARVEQMNSSLDPNMVNDSEAAGSADTETNTDTMTTPKSTDGQYDVIDVMAATGAGAGKTKSGQTTRIYTTGEVNDDFWLKHLGDDFKHAIHLQVGGTNEDYNRIINQTSGGVHEEVHHEYLPGAERPPDAQQQLQSVDSNGYGHPNFGRQLNLDGEAFALKQNYLRQQEEQRFAQGGYAQQNTHYNTDNNNYNTHNNYNNYNNNGHRGVYNTHRHQHTHTYPTHLHTQPQPQHQQQQQYPRGSKSRHSMRNRYKHPSQPGSGPMSSIINSSEDTLHTAQSQATPTSAASPSSSSSRRDDVDNPLPFKSPFNDYGSRPTRDLTYLLYKRGL